MEEGACHARARGQGPYLFLTESEEEEEEEISLEIMHTTIIACAMIASLERVKQKGTVVIN